MIDRLARFAPRMYPLAFWRRYGDETSAVLDQTPARPRTVLDLLHGALSARLRPPEAAASVVDAADRLRAGTSGVLLCWVFFAAAGFGFFKATEDGPFSAAGHAHALLNDAHLAVQALAIVASAAVVVGALPLIVATLAHARREPALRRLVTLALLPVLIFAGLTAALVLITHAEPPGHGSVAGARCGGPLADLVLASALAATATRRGWRTQTQACGR